MILSRSELSDIEEEIDIVLRAERLKAERGDKNAVDTLNVVAHRLENLIHDRRTILAARSPVAFVAKVKEETKASTERQSVET